MEYFDTAQCDFLSLGFAFDEGLGDDGVINSQMAMSLQDCNGTERYHDQINGTAILLHQNAKCAITDKLSVANSVNGTQFIDYIKSIVVNASAIAQKQIIISENDQDQPNCTGFMLDLFNQSSWVKNYSDYHYVYIYQGGKSEDCTNTIKNWNETSDLLGMARESAFQMSLDKRCAGIMPTPSPSDNNSLKSGLIVSGVLAGVCVVALLAAYILHKKDHSGYAPV